MPSVAGIKLDRSDVIAQASRSNGSGEKDRPLPLPLGPWNDPTQQTPPSGEPLLDPYTFVTTCDPQYVPGLLALIQSLKDHAAIPFRFIVIEYKPLTDGNREAIAALGIDVEYIPKADLGRFEFDRTMTHEPRMAANFDKFLIWNLPVSGPLCYLDTDIICLNPMTGIEAFDTLSVVVKASVIGCQPDDSAAYRPSGVHPFNAGVLFFSPDPQTFHDAQIYAKSYTGKIRFGDQVVANDYFASCRPEDINWIDCGWNASTWLLRSHPGLCDSRDVRLLHFAHADKPWSHTPAHDWKTEHWRRWWDVYNRATHPVPRRQSLESREDFGRFLADHNVVGSGAEVGVFRGENAARIAQHWGGRLTLIDRTIQPEARQALEPFGDRVAFVESRSPEAAAQFSNRAFDWIYIDADHRYRPVCDDLRAWWSKLKPGGLFAGHDYLNSADSPRPNRQPKPMTGTPADVSALPYAVRAAVDEFAAEKGLRVFRSAGPPTEPNSPSWFCWKPSP